MQCTQICYGAFIFYLFAELNEKKKRKRFSYKYLCLHYIIISFYFIKIWFFPILILKNFKKCQYYIMNEIEIIMICYIL